MRRPSSPVWGVVSAASTGPGSRKLLGHITVLANKVQGIACVGVRMRTSAAFSAQRPLRSYRGWRHATLRGHAAARSQMARNKGGGQTALNMAWAGAAPRALARRTGAFPGLCYGQEKLRWTPFDRRARPAGLQLGGAHARLHAGAQACRPTLSRWPAPRRRRFVRRHST